MNFCSNCGDRVVRMVPEGDDRERFICRGCQTVHYQNPKVVVGCIPEFKGKILLCQRSIQPRYGKWTLPAGYLENGETVADGARRETLEETGARVLDLRPFALFNLCFVNQVYLMFRSIIDSPDFFPGKESLSVAFFRKENIPWDNLAFSVISETLKRYFSDREKGIFSFHMADIRPARKAAEAD